MSKNKSIANDQAAAEEKPAEEAPSIFQDEFAGQGGSYIVDPLTNQRVKNTGDTQNG